MKLGIIGAGNMASAIIGGMSVPGTDIMQRGPPLRTPELHFIFQFWIQ